MGLTYRVLTAEEYAIAPRGVRGSEQFTPENSILFGAVNEQGEVVSTWFIYMPVHIEGLWIREDYRKSKSVIRRMTDGIKSWLEENGVSSCYAVIMDSTPQMHRFARWFGGEPVGGTLYNWTKKE